MQAAFTSDRCVNCYTVRWWGLVANPKHWFTTSFLQRKAMLGVWLGGTLGLVVSTLGVLQASLSGTRPPNSATIGHGFEGALNSHLRSAHLSTEIAPKWHDVSALCKVAETLSTALLVEHKNSLCFCGMCR